MPPCEMIGCKTAGELFYRQKLFCNHHYEHHKFPIPRARFVGTIVDLNFMLDAKSHGHIYNQVPSRISTGGSQMETANRRKKGRKHGR